MLKLVALILSLWSPDWQILSRPNPKTVPARDLSRASATPLAPQQTPPTVYQPNDDLGPCLDPNGRPVSCNPGP